MSDCATSVAVPSGSKRSIPIAPLPKFFATSPATASNTSVGDDSRATSVATRRSAACSSASLSTSALAWAFDMAVATSSVKPWRRASVSAGNGTSFDVAIITPHVRPRTEIGTPMEKRIPICRIVSAMTPGASS